jgi:hypothetical protein
MSKISSLRGMMQMMDNTKDGVNRKSRTVRSLIHCEGKVTLGFQTSKKEELFFLGGLIDTETGRESILSTLIRCSRYVIKVFCEQDKKSSFKLLTENLDFILLNGIKTYCRLIPYKAILI